MDDEKLEKLLENLRQNRAQFLDGLQKMQDVQMGMQIVQKESENRIGDLETIMVSLINVTMQNSKMVDKLGEKVDKLADVPRKTDERFDAVIFIAEKYFSRNNGDSDKNKFRW